MHAFCVLCMCCVQWYDKVFVINIQILLDKLNNFIHEFSMEKLRQSTQIMNRIFK